MSARGSSLRASVVAVAVAVTGCAWSVHRDARLDALVHGLTHHQVHDGDRTVWYYVGGSTGGPAVGRQLLVLLDGSRRASVLGLEHRGGLVDPGLVYPILEHGRPGLDVLAVETTFSFEPFRDHYRDPRVLEHHTLEDRVRAAALAVDDHLAAHRYDRVVLFGYSEGAAIAARVYLALRSRAAVSELAVGGYGGLSQRAQFQLLRRSSVAMPDGYRAALGELEAREAEIAQAPRALDRWWLGWPFRRWSSFLAYEPLEDLKAVGVPLLVVHGARDASSPVESSRFLVAELAKAGRTDVVYKEYPRLDHGLGDAAFEELVAALFP